MSFIKELKNPEWVVTVLAAYLCHTYKCRIVGFMVDYDVNFSSTLFVLGFAILFGEYKLWPCTLRRPPGALLLLYEVLMTVLLTNIARTLVWMPAVVTLREYIPIMAKKVMHLNSWLKLRKYGVLFKFSRWLDSDCGLHELSKIMSIVIFIWVLYSTDTIDHIGELVRKIRHKLRRKVCVTICAPPKRPGCSLPPGRDLSVDVSMTSASLGNMPDGPIMPRSSASGDAINLRRDNLDSDTDDALSPDTAAAAPVGI